VITSTFENVSDIGVCLGLSLGPPAIAGIRSKRGAVQRGRVGRRDQQRRKPRNCSPHLLAPTIDLARRNLGPPSDLGNYGARREAFGDNRPLLLVAPAPPPLNASDYLNPRHRTVASTSANTVLCTGAKPADHQLARRPSPDGYDLKQAIDFKLFYRLLRVACFGYLTSEFDRPG
jgi:hypothetical protein